MTEHARLNYPTKAKVHAALEYAREAGLDVAGFEVAPNGTIRVLTPAAFPAAPQDEFDKWDKAGKL